jgi:hypothetical protein
VDERTGGVMGTRMASDATDGGSPEGAADSEDQAERLEEKVDAIRDNLGNLVGELDRRRHRAMKPLMIGVAVMGGLAIAGGIAYLVWRRRRRPSRLNRVLQSLRSVAAPAGVAARLPAR